VRYPAAVALSIALVFLSPGPAAGSEPGAAAIREAADSERLFQAGMNDYAAGDLAAALASFREVHRREPNNLAALAAVHRLERESSARRPAEAAAPKPAAIKTADRFFLGSLSPWFYFERRLRSFFRREPVAPRTVKKN
jgi:hypothetical protein